MKNIYIIPTDKPSRLAIEDKELILVNNIGNYRNAQNIYITSDEEIISFDEINSLSLQYGKDIQTNMSNI